MKTETPPTPTPSIADLWGELSTRHLRESERLQWDHMRENGQITEDQYKEHLDYVQSLRQQLVERCNDDHGLSIEDGGDILRIVRDRLHFVTVCGAYHARNEGSAWLFMGWELQQREMEAQNGK